MAGLTVQSAVPLIVELLPSGGIGSGPPIKIPASQVVIRLPDNTPVCVVSAYGPDGCYAISHAMDEDFNRMLRNLGITMSQVKVDRVELPAPPPGARLISSPN